MSPTTTTLLTLPPDIIDDLIYACRTSDHEWLSELLTTTAKELQTTESTIIRLTIDVDGDGIGSRACLLHYPAANGDVKLVEILLNKLGEALQTSTSTSTSTVMAQNTNINTETETDTNANIDTQDTNTDTDKDTHLNTEDKITDITSFVNHQNESGNTPLHWAALNGHLEVVKVLVKAGADPTILNGAGRDVVVEAEYSAKDGAVECAVWLLGECEGLERGAGVGSFGERQGQRSEGVEGDIDVEDVDVKVSAGDVGDEKSLVNGNH